MSKKLKILYASAEVVPFAKTGGLADVAGALPAELAEMGHDVRVVMPRFSSIDGAKYGLKTITAPFQIPLGNSLIAITIAESSAIAGVPTYFIENEEFFARDSLYGQADDDSRFTVYCRGMLEMFAQIGWTPDVISCNDWHSALVPVYLKTIYADQEKFRRIATLFTVHNLAYQGSFSEKVMEIAGLPRELFTWDKLAYWNTFNFMKVGLLYADVISTVSEGYAKEIATKEYGAGLEGVIEYRKHDLFGILNGIDYSIWNPRTDPLIPANFSVNELKGKAECKRALQQEMGLGVDANTPLFGLISRLSSQKGLDILAEVLPELLKKQKMQVVILGTGDEY
ncbi:MAG: glycogen/starch synthase, partial [bacterium]